MTVETRQGSRVDFLADTSFLTVTVCYFETRCKTEIASATISKDDFIMRGEEEKGICGHHRLYLKVWTTLAVGDLQDDHDKQYSRILLLVSSWIEISEQKGS